MSRCVGPAGSIGGSLPHQPPTSAVPTFQSQLIDATSLAASQSRHAPDLGPHNNKILLMRLINTLTLELELFIEPPPYAILSHRWTKDEVLFEDVGRPLDEWKHKAGAAKVLQGSVTALALGHRYIWIDSCCIDKRSSAELTEAINSMYAWYRDAELCLVFLSDVRSADGLLGSLWFTRGWTLQELVAPYSLRFYSASWADLGSRESWAEQISQTTCISLELLQQTTHQRRTLDSTRQLLDSYSTHKKMSWAAKRVTTRAEDLAYSMIGIFGVNMPLIYGEGKAKAFRRLQEEILKSSYDQSILAHISTAPSPFFTMGPEAFSYGLEIVKGRDSLTHSIEISGSALSLDLILCPLSRPSNAYELAIGCLECYVKIGDTMITRPGLLLERYLDGWCRYKWDAIYLMHPGNGNIARAFPPHFGHHEFTHWKRQTIRLYDGNQPDLRIGEISRPGAGNWQERAVMLGTIKQSDGSRYCFGHTTPDEHEGLVSLANVLCFVPGMEVRSIIWLSVVEGEVRQYRCAILCGIVGYGPSSDTVRCWPITAEKLFPYPRLRGQTLDSSNPNLVDLLSKKSIVKMLGKITGPPLGAGGYIPRGFSDLKTGVDNIKAGLEESTFLETSYLTLNIEITSTRS